uniref:RAN binding protein 17 n=1 Tax=Rousettus aegyptiacus TaxID=9407 RepID=A0A7J8FLB8_ROUAE|nr:RAN binding protein 17 [Rousettus aegyptiacus]
MALHFQSLAELEVLCTHLYIGTDLTQRIEAEKALLELIDSPECLSKCQLLLEQGTTSYAQLLAATCLSKLISRVSPLPVEQRIDIRNYILNYVASQLKLAPFVIQALIQVIAKITKLGWFEVQKDQFVFREIIADVKKFLQGTMEHCIIGVIILSELTQEMNLVDYSRPSAKHRKIATSFRDTSLKDILVLACSLLKEVLAKPLNLQDESQQTLVMQVLKLVLNCLNFDFIGSLADESADDLCTVQIPTTWRTIFLEPETLDLFFNLYHSLPPLLSQLALSCLVQFASTRRSLFSSPERAKYLGNLIKGVRRILENPQGLSDPGNYHEFCRFLARLKTNYQLGELVMVKEYPEVIRLIANFTITSLQHWEFAPNSVHYLLTLWQRMVASVPFVKSTEPHLLDTYAPEITKAFITSRLESVAIVVRDHLDDPLDDAATVFQQLEQLCTVSRCEYEKTCTLLVQLFDQNAQNYQKLLHSASGITVDMAIQEGRLAWLVYLVGTVVGGRLTYTSTDEHDAMDGELSCRVFQLISLMDTGLPRCSNEKIELAILWFLDQFRKTYVGDQLQRTSKEQNIVYKPDCLVQIPNLLLPSRVYARMSEVLGITDDNHVLETFMTKIVTNLKYWGRCEPVISRTLQFLNDLSVGYILLKKLVKIDAVKFMLKNHTSEHFPFLGISDRYSLSDFRCRTTFYTALTRLLMVDLGEDEDEFENFMLPLTVSFETILQIFNNNFKQEDVKRMLIGLARDLRGIAFALNTKTSYTMLFDWMYPAYLPILQRAVERWYGEPACTTPILKLMAELMQNRSQRLNFDASSPNGILLFREASKMICTYAISETEPVLLPAAGVPHPGPHELHHPLGASRTPVRPHVHLRGPHYSRYSGLLQLLYQLRLHRHLPLQAHSKRGQEATSDPGGHPGRPETVTFYAAKSRCPAADDVGPHEHHRLRRLSEPVVSIQASPGARPAQREVFQRIEGKSDKQPASPQAGGPRPVLQEPDGGGGAEPVHQEQRQVHPEPVRLQKGRGRGPAQRGQHRTVRSGHDELTRLLQPRARPPFPRDSCGSESQHRDVG